MDPIKVNLQSTKTEAGWIAASDHFWLAATPRLFEWLRWAVMLAAVSYVAQRSDSLALKSLLSLCYLGMWFYYQAFFARIQFRRFPWLKSRRAERLASILVSLILALGTYALVFLSVDALVSAHP